MKKSFLTIVIAFSFSSSIFAQEWHDSLNTATNAKYLSAAEKAVIFEINKVRTNPQKYAKLIKKEGKNYQGIYLKREGRDPFATIDGVAGLNECISYLKKIKPMGVLRPDENLFKAAEVHAKDLSNTGQTGHKGSDGSNTIDRIKQFSSEEYHSYNESISFRENDAFYIVLQLLIDDGVPSRIHRENMTKNTYTKCGVSNKSHPEYKNTCVIIYTQ